MTTTVLTTVNLSDEVVNFYTREELEILFTPAEMSRMQNEVLASVNQELQKTEELHVTIPRLLRSCRTEAAEVRKAMLAMVTTQTGEAFRSLKTLREARQKVEQLRSSFVEQGSILSGMQSAACYRQLRKLSTLRNNVNKIIEWTDTLKAIHHGEEVLEEIDNGQILSAHRRLRKAQEIRLAIRSASRGHDHRGDLFDAHFLKLDFCIQAFVVEVQRIAVDSTMTAILSFQEYEDKEQQATVDENFRKLSECVQVFAAEQAEPTLHVTLQDKPLFQEATVKEWVATSVSNAWLEEIMEAITDSVAQASQYLEEMKRVEQLMQALEMTLSPLSSQFPFFALMITAFHGEITRVLRMYADPQTNLDAEKLMECIQFTRWYSDMLDENNFTQYVNRQECDDVIAIMMKGAVSGMSNHLIFLSQSCATTTCSRDPKTLPNGKKWTPGPVDLFAILQQSLGTIALGTEVEVAQKLGRACVDGITSYIRTCAENMDFDLWEDEIAGRGELTYEQWTNKRFDKLLAFCNDLSTIEESLDTIERLFATSWTEDIEQTPFQELQDKIPEFASFYVEEMVDHVKRTVAGEWDNMFSASWVNDDNSLQVILNTVAEFIDDDFTAGLQEVHLKKVVKSLMMDVFRTYLHTLVKAHSAAKDKPWKTADEVDAFSHALDRDAMTLSEFWEDYITGSRAQIIEQGANAIRTLSAAAIAVKDIETFDRFVVTKMLDSFGDCPTFVIQYVVDRRGDLSKSSREGIMSRWKERIAFQRRENDINKDWKLGQTFLGAVSRDLAPQEKGGFFSKKPKREDEQTKRQKLKEEKRKARDEAKAKKVAAAAPKRPPKATDSAGVEVMTLDQLLKS